MKKNTSVIDQRRRTRAKNNLRPKAVKDAVTSLPAPVIIVVIIWIVILIFAVTNHLE